MYMSVFKLWVFKHTEWASQVALVVENLPINEGGARDGGVYPWVGRTLEEGTTTHSRYSCLEIPMDRAA